MGHIQEMRIFVAGLLASWRFLRYTISQLQFLELSGLLAYHLPDTEKPGSELMTIHFEDNSRIENTAKQTNRYTRSASMKRSNLSGVTASR